MWIVAILVGGPLDGRLIEIDVARSQPPPSVPFLDGAGAPHTYLRSGSTSRARHWRYIHQIPLDESLERAG